MKKSELREIIREELTRLSEGKPISGLQASFDFFEANKGSAGEVFEHDGGKLVSLGKGDPLKLFKGKVVPELRQAFASNTPVVGLDTKEASKVKRGDASFGFKIGRDLFYIFK